MRICLVALAVNVIAASTCYAQATSPNIKIADGELAGHRSGASEAFLGIPFAAPPVGGNRWRAPQPPARWQGTREATVFGPSCPQPVAKAGFGPWTHEYVVQNQVNEDCLSLNVWRPANIAGKRPVLVWIHGGGFSSGSGSVPIYDGAALASRGILVVTINYRLGVLGFLAHPELSAQATGDAPGNFGLQDQIAALKWVKRNIAAFGGDPDAVTIAGQSAGSVSVHALVASPMAEGLFRAAIAESGLPGLLPMRSLKDAEQDGVAFGVARKAPTLAAMRRLPIEALMTPADGERPSPFRFGPIVDGALLPADPVQMFADGRTKDIPMIVGQNVDEASAMSPAYGANTSEAYARLLDGSFGDRVGLFKSIYPSDSDEERRKSSKLILLDRGLAGMWDWSRLRDRHALSPTYGYLFSHIEPGQEAPKYGAFHSSEIPYVFGTLAASPERGFGSVDQKISAAMMSYWINFTVTGNPNGKGLTAWPAFRSADPKVLKLDDVTAVKPLLPPVTMKAMQSFIKDGGRVSMF
ncbi:MAG: carboxylesterase [Oxalobacteraceae bacterium]|nr:MAG: carboxylesterase [Oxalobacteraceae bacterium]